VTNGELRLTRAPKGTFISHSSVLDPDDVARAIRRMAHEVIEHNHGPADVVLIGLERGGVPIADALRAAIAEIDGSEIPMGSLDVAFYRDDIGTNTVLPEVTRVPFPVTDRDVVLVDDVLFTGRAVRAALDAITDFGRPRSIQLAVMVDRGHRELPIRPDYVGKNLPTRQPRAVKASMLLRATREWAMSPTIATSRPSKVRPASLIV